MVAFSQQVTCDIWVKNHERPAFLTALAAQFSVQITAEPLCESERPFPLEA